MVSLRTALLLLPPVSVLLVAAVRCLDRVAERKLSALARAHQLARPPSTRELPAVALYRRRRRSGGGGGDDDQEECVFCLSVIEEGSEVREVRCRHLFHRRCLDRWLLARPLATCPLCRCRLLAAALEVDSDSDSDMTLFMACVHSRSSWLWPSS